MAKRRLATTTSGDARAIIAALPDDASAEVLARALTREVIIALGEMVLNQFTRPHSRVRAAQLLLDRGWGQAAATFTVKQHSDLERLNDAELAALVRHELALARRGSGQQPLVIEAEVETGPDSVH